jgi:hypothetical protein
MVGEIPIERSAQLILLLLYLCFTWIGGVDSKYGSTADQGRTGREVSSSRLWRPARALGTHAKQGPSTGHSAVGLRQPGNTLLTPRPHFTAHHARLVIKWFVLRTALLFVRSAVRLVYTELPGRVAVCLPKQALGRCVIVSWVATASLSPSSPAQRRRPHRSLPHRAAPATVYQARPKANPGHPHRQPRPGAHRPRQPRRMVTLRVAGRLHHVGVGRIHGGRRRFPTDGSNPQYR